MHIKRPRASGEVEGSPAKESDEKMPKKMLRRNTEWKVQDFSEHEGTVLQHFRPIMQGMIPATLDLIDGRGFRYGCRQGLSMHRGGHKI